MTAKPKVNYVDKQELHDAITEYYTTDILPDRLHVMFYKMAEHISRKSWYIGYTYRDDMVSAAYMRCIYAIKLKKFDIERFQPFSYFQTTIEREFSKFKTKEKIYQERKWRALSELISNVEIEHQITLAIPDDIKLKMYAATATIATLRGNEDKVEFDEELLGDVEDNLEEEQDE